MRNTIQNIAHLISLLMLLSTSISGFAMSPMESDKHSDMKANMPEMVISMSEMPMGMVSMMDMEHCDEGSTVLASVCMEHCAALYALPSSYLFSFFEPSNTAYTEVINQSPDTRPYVHWRPPSSYS